MSADGRLPPPHRAGDAAPAYEELAAAWRALRPRGVRVREVACVGAPRTLLAAELGDATLPTISISAGVHGDEPAAPWALLSLVRDGLLDARFAYRIWPCVNPSGYRAGTRENAEGDDVNRSFSRGGQTPEARAVLTANRDRRFAFALDLHEDYEADGAYVYEPLRPGFAPYFSDAVVARARRRGASRYRSSVKASISASRSAPTATSTGSTAAIVLVDYEAEMRLFEGLPGSLALMYRGTPAALTIESPRPRAVGRADRGAPRRGRPRALSLVRDSSPGPRNRAGHG